MKIELTLSQITAAFQALTVILQQKGIPFKTNYWLKRNQDHLFIETKIFGEAVKKTFDESAMEVPANHPFISPDRYGKFKEGLLNKEFHGAKEREDYFASFEETSKISRKFMPKEMLKDFQSQINKEAEELKKEVEYTEIPVASEAKEFATFVKLSGMPGNIIGNIWWMLNVDDHTESVKVEKEEES